MTAVDHAELKRLAEWLRAQGERHRPNAANFTAAADGYAALLSEIEGLKSYAKDAANEALEYRRELAALRTQDPDSWRPIETAPKDGANFDSQDRTNYGKRVFTKTHWYVHPSVQGWVTDEIDCGDYEFEPTHWRPSALRPQTAESGK